MSINFVRSRQRGMGRGTTANQKTVPDSVGGKMILVPQRTSVRRWRNEPGQSLSAFPVGLTGGNFIVLLKLHPNCNGYGRRPSKLFWRGDWFLCSRGNRRY